MNCVIKIIINHNNEKNIINLLNKQFNIKHMKKILLSLCMLGFVCFLNAQTIVSTTPQNKKIVLEEFTGTGCPNCPGGHTTAAGILTANTGNVFVVAYHPNNSSYTTGDPMASAFPAAFYTSPFISPSNRYMPSAMINRRVWSTERIQGTTSWASDIDVIKAETSPLNVGVSSTYNTTSKILTVNVEVYFTANVTDVVTIYAELTEDGIIATQSGGTSPYTHNHVFRKAFVAQWGDAISTPTTQGTLKTFSYSFDNTITNYDMTKAEVLAFVRNVTNEEIISANGAEVGNSSLGINSLTNNLDKVSVFPNPCNENTKIQLSLSKSDKVEYSIFNAVGQKLISKEMGILNTGNHYLSIDKNRLDNKGIYFIQIKIGQKNYIEKMIVE